MIAICTFKTKIGYKKFITLIGSNKLVSAKNSESGLTFHPTVGRSIIESPTAFDLNIPL